MYLDPNYIEFKFKYLELSMLSSGNIESYGCQIGALENAYRSLTAFEYSL
jgi:hypothetical protein